jgi:anti-sigma factor RsiW
MTHETLPLRCRDVVEFLDRYYGGELAPDARLVFEDHVARCPECGAYLRTYAQTIRLAKGAWSESESAPPAGVPEELVRAILAASRRGRG